MTGIDVYDLLHNLIIAKSNPYRCYGPITPWIHTHVKWNYKCQAQNDSIRNGVKHTENAMIPQNTIMFCINELYSFVTVLLCKNVLVYMWLYKNVFV